MSTLVLSDLHLGSRLRHDVLTQPEPRRRWRGPQGRPRILNTGSWVYEPLLVHNATAPHPYWPGGAVILEDNRAPRTVGLLDAVPAGAMH